MKKINSLVALVTSLIMTAPLVSTAFAETVSDSNGSANAVRPAVTMEAVPPQAQAPAAVPAVTTGPFPIGGGVSYTTTTMYAPQWPEIHFDFDGAGGRPGNIFTFAFQGYDDGESPISFTISDESIARITKVEGMKVTFEMLAPGITCIRGTTPDGRYAESEIEVLSPEPAETEPIPVDGVEFSRDTVYLDPGETAEIEVKGYKGNLYDEYDGTHEVNLYCLEKDIVKVVKTEGNKFTLEGVSTGFAHVYAEFGPGIYAEMRVFVKPLPELRLSPERVELYPEDYYQISLEGYYEYLDVIPADSTTVTYKFDDSSLVEITSVNEYGIEFIGAASGSTVLHATVPDGRTAEVPITILPNKFRFDCDGADCLPGDTIHLSVKGGDAVFSVENDGILEVISFDSRKLEISALAPGETTVTATCGDQTSTVHITVTDPATTTTTATQTTLALWCTTGAGTTTTTAVGTTTAAAGTTNETDGTEAGAAETTTVPEATGTTAAAEATAAAETTTAETTTAETTAAAAAEGNLPQTGNHNATHMLVIIGACMLTGTGITILKCAGKRDSKEQSE